MLVLRELDLRLAVYPTDIPRILELVFAVHQTVLAVFPMDIHRAVALGLWACSKDIRLEVRDLPVLVAFLDLKGIQKTVPVRQAVGDLLLDSLGNWQGWMLEVLRGLVFEGIRLLVRLVVGVGMVVGVCCSRIHFGQVYCPKVNLKLEQKCLLI